MLFLLAPLIAFFRLITTFDVSPELIATDQLNSFYMARRNTLERINSKGEITGSHTLKTLGKIHTIDPANPMKTLVYYRDFNTIVFLDNMMTQIGDPVNLSTLGLERVTAVCRSFNNGIWVYDSGNKELIRLDQNYNISHRSGNLTSIIGYVPEPTHLNEQGKYLLLNHPDKGILVFDVYGTYIKTVPVTDLSDMQVLEDRFIYLRNDSLHSYDLKFLKDSAIALPERSVIAIRITTDRLLLQTRGALRLYEIK